MREADLSTMNRDTILGLAPQFRADAEAAARSPTTDVNQGELREVIERDPFDDRIRRHKFYGPVRSLLDQFSQPRMVVKGGLSRFHELARMAEQAQAAQARGH